MASPTQWFFREGDVAYLRNAEGYSPADWEQLNVSHPHTITQDRCSKKQTNHPCVVLKKLPGDRFVISTVSSHGGGVVAPWKRGRRSQRNPDDFRAFVGSESPNKQRPDLRLKPGQQWPMPRSSWTNVRTVLEVPGSILGTFDKAEYRSGPLTMDPDSLDDLRCHVAQTGHYKDVLRAWGFSTQRVVTRRPSINGSWRPSSSTTTPPSTPTSSTSSPTTTPPSTPKWKPAPPRTPPQVPTRISSLPTAPAKGPPMSWASVAAALPEVRRPTVKAH